MGDRRIAGRYRLLDRHAIGGMASVWRARDERTGELVAIKRLHPHTVADPASRARLEREGAALQTLDHPAIVGLRDLVEDPDAPALVMDFVPGRTLDERIAEGPLPAGEAVAIATAVADALAVAHAQGIVHRDVKPGNILLDGQGAPHLVDFGIAMLDEAGDALTAPAEMVGTLRYAAPERLAGEAATARTDVWGLGAVLYEMLTGVPVVAANDPAGAVAASEAGPADLSTLPRIVAPIVARSLATDPAERYPDAAAMRDALEASSAPVDADAPTSVIPLTSRDQVARPGVRAGAGVDRERRRPRAPWVALALAGAIGGAVVLAGLGQLRGQGAAPPPAAAEQPGPAASATPTRTPAPSARAADGGASSKAAGKSHGKSRGHH